jgi:hypothetical protein
MGNVDVPATTSLAGRWKVCACSVIILFAIRSYMIEQQSKLASQKILLISYYFYPHAAVGAKRPSELALALMAAGARVSVVAARSRQYLPIDHTLRERIRNVDISYVPVPPSMIDAIWKYSRKIWFRENRAPTPDLQEPGTQNSDTESWLRRIRRYFISMQALFDSRKLWCLLTSFKVLFLRMTDSFDVIISSGPLMVAHLPALLAAKLFRARWIIDLRDPWSCPVPRQENSKLRSFLENKIEEVSYRTCSRIVCASPGIMRQTTARYPWVTSKFNVIYNGFDHVLSAKPKKPSGTLTLLYAGSLYLNRNPFPLLQAFASLLQDPVVQRENVSVRFVGECQEWEGTNLVRWLEQQGIEDRVTVEPPVDSRQLQALILDADVLINFAQGQPDCIPAKTFEYLASGKQILCLSEEHSDTSILVRETGIGRVVTPGDTEEFRRVLYDFYDYFVVQHKAYISPPTDNRYSRRAQNERYLSVIEELV